MSSRASSTGSGGNLTIFKKGLILVAIPLLAQLLFLAVLFKMRQDQQEAQRWAMHTKNVIARTEGVYRLLMEARGAVRSLALTGNSEFADAWEAKRTRLPATLKELHALVGDRPKQQTRLERLRRQTEEALLRLDGICRLAQVEESRRQALDELRQAKGLRILDPVRATIDEFLGTEERLDGARQAELVRTRYEQDWTLIGGAVLAAISTLALAVVFSRGISSRLAVLSDNARRLAAGTPLAPPLGGGDEWGQLDRVFHDMADALAQKDRENEMFVYSVSHDLRSPLVNLQGFSQELALICEDLRRIVGEDDVPADVRQRIVGLIDHDVGESIRFIHTAVRRLASIIDSLLRLSRVGRVEYQRQAVQVRDVVEQVVQAMGNSIAQKKARIVVGDLPPAWGDPTAIEQIFANLIGNAVNYLDPARPGEIEVGSTEGAEATDPRTYWVKDNGMGIVAEHMPKIFLAFQRLHPHLAEGEGIGLPLVRRMVERHGGRIWVESIAGQGSTFYVTLPAPALNGKSDREIQTPITIHNGDKTAWPPKQST